MVMVAVISALIVAAAATVFARARFWRRDLQRLAHVARWRSEFFAATAQLTSDQAVPVQVRQILEFLAEHIDHKTIGGTVLSSLIATRDAGRNALQGPHPADNLSVASRMAFAQAIYSFMLSVGFGDRRHGKAILQVLAEVLAVESRETVTTKAIDDFARRERSHRRQELAAA